MSVLVRSSGEIQSDFPAGQWKELSYFLPDNVQQEARAHWWVPAVLGLAQWVLSLSTVTCPGAMKGSLYTCRSPSYLHQPLRLSLREPRRSHCCQYWRQRGAAGDGCEFSRAPVGWPHSQTGCSQGGTAGPRTINRQALLPAAATGPAWCCMCSMRARRRGDRGRHPPLPITVHMPLNSTLCFSRLPQLVCCLCRTLWTSWASAQMRRWGCTSWRGPSCITGTWSSSRSSGRSRQSRTAQKVTLTAEFARELHQETS